MRLSNETYFHYTTAAYLVVPSERRGPGLNRHFFVGINAYMALDSIDDRTV